MIVLGTRGSALALAQSRLVADALGPDVELRVLSTQGDRSERPLSELGDGVFVTAIEDALRAGAVDLAVHSLKDLPTAEAPGLVLAAITAREDPRDVLVTAARGGLPSLKRGGVVGTSSPRRAAFARALRADLVVREIRGNVDTRLRKVQGGEYDAVIVALAGLRRLGIAVADAEIIDARLCPPAPGQGALAVQVREHDAALRDRVIRALDHAPTRRAVTAERELLRLLGASCALALGALARADDGEVVLDAALATETGLARASARGADPLEVARRAAASLGSAVHA